MEPFQDDILSRRLDDNRLATMLDAINGAGDIHIAAPGLGPDDGFTAYKAYGGSHPFTRWGDYGAAAVESGDARCRDRVRSRGAPGPQRHRERADVRSLAARVADLERRLQELRPGP